MQLEFLSNADQGMQGKIVRRDAGPEVPLVVEKNCDIFRRVKLGRLLVVVAA